MSAPIYVDTSLLAKRYLRASDSSQAIAFLDGARIVTSAITEIELISTVWTAQREKMLTKAQARELSMRIDEDSTRWNVVELTVPTLRRARQIIAEQPIRTADAIHCASAAIFEEEYGEPILFATSDRRQSDVAVALGFRLNGPPS